MSVSIGANAQSQLVCFLLCLAFGCLGGAFGLLYLRKASFFERVLTDFFATICIGGAFFLALEFAMSGQIRFYGVVGYLSGVATVLYLGKLALRYKNRKTENIEETEQKKDK